MTVVARVPTLDCNSSTRAELFALVLALWSSRPGSTVVIICDSECAITATDGGPEMLLMKTVCRNTKHWKPIALAQLAVVVLGLDVIMLPIMSHGADSEGCGDLDHAARLNKEADAGAELAARLLMPECWDESIC